MGLNTERAWMDGWISHTKKKKNAQQQYMRWMDGWMDGWG